MLPEDNLPDVKDMSVTMGRLMCAIVTHSKLTTTDLALELHQQASDFFPEMQCMVTVQAPFLANLKRAMKKKDACYDKIDRALSTCPQADIDIP
jgi:hypothetical protein